MKYLFTLIVSFTISGNSFAQNAEVIENWLNSVEKEFKEIDQTSATSTLRSGSPIYNRVRFNLLSDAYFIPVFGKSFDELSPSKLKGIDNKIRGLKQKKKFGSRFEPKHPWMKRLDWYLWGVFKQSQPYETAVKEVQDLRRIKKEYANTTQKLKSGQLDFTNLTSEKGQVNAKYGKLIPKDIDFIKSLIDEQEKHTANKAIGTIIETLNNFENDYSSLKKVERLKIENKTLYTSADINAQRNYDEQIENKISQILSISSTKETESLASMSANELNKLNMSFNRKYATYSARKEIRLANDQIHEAKKKKVISEFDDISSKIKASESFGDLNAIENVYLSLLYQLNDPKISSLSEKIAVRRKEIENENELRKVAERNLQETAEGEAMVLNTDGLYLGEFFDIMFRGHFENIDINNEDPFLFAIFSEYLRAYGKQCSEYLPDDKVDIMDLVCVKENVTTDGYGFEISRVCIQWTPKRSGLYARPDLYNAKMELEDFQRKTALQTGIDLISNPNAMGNSLDLLHKGKGLQKDLLEIFKLNSCTSNSIRRFEENLKLFALKKTGIRMEGVSKYIEMKKTGGPSGAQDVTKLIDDLVTNQSETWALNRYKPKSIKGVIQIGRDQQGRPSALKATYTYFSFGASRTGSVNIAFKNGLPDCIYFSDFPENCKNPNPGIVSSYAQGDYRLE